MRFGQFPKSPILPGDFPAYPVFPIFQNRPRALPVLDAPKLDRQSRKWHFLRKKLVFILAVLSYIMIFATDSGPYRTRR